MSTRAVLVAVVGLVCVGLAVAGCQTYGEGAGLGAVIGAGTGALIGSASGHAGQGALIGAAVGGVAGLIAHDIKARRAKDAQATAKDYSYQPSQGEVLRMENNQALPSIVAPGNKIEASIQYALLGAGSQGAPITEVRQLRHGPDVLAETSATVTRPDGTWVSTQQFDLPRNAAPGEYALTQTVATAKSRVSGTSYFTVQ